MREKRKGRVESLLKREISSIIFEEIDKPKGVKFVSVWKVDLSKDGRKVTVYISALTKEEAVLMIDVLSKATGYIHHVLGKRLRMKIIPRPEFKLSPDIELM